LKLACLKFMIQILVDYVVHDRVFNSLIKIFFNTFALVLCIYFPNILGQETAK